MISWWYVGSLYKKILLCNLVKAVSVDNLSPWEDKEFDLAKFVGEILFIITFKLLFLLSVSSTFSAHVCFQKHSWK